MRSTFIYFLIAYNKKKGSEGEEVEVEERLKSVLDDH